MYIGIIIVYFLFIYKKYIYMNNYKKYKNYRYILNLNKYKYIYKEKNIIKFYINIRKFRKYNNKIFNNNIKLFNTFLKLYYNNSYENYDQLIILRKNILNNFSSFIFFLPNNKLDKFNKYSKNIKNQLDDYIFNIENIIKNKWHNKSITYISKPLLNSIYEPEPNVYTDMYFNKNFNLY